MNTKYLKTSFIAVSAFFYSSFCFSKKAGDMILPSYCAEFTGISKEGEKPEIEENTNGPYEECHGDVYIKIESSDLVETVEDILNSTRIRNQNKGPFSFKEKPFKQEARGFKNKLLIKAVSNLKKKKRELLDIYPIYESFEDDYNEGSFTCSNNTIVADVIKEDREQSKNLKVKKSPKGGISDKQKAFLEFNLINAISIQAQSNFIDNKEKELNSKMKESLRGYEQELDTDERVRTCWQNIANRSRGSSVNESFAFKNCKKQFMKTKKSEILKSIKEELAPLRIKFAKGMSSSPLLYQAKNSFKVSDWVNLKPKSSNLSKFLTKDINESKLEELGHILNSEDKERLLQFKEENSEIFNFEKKLESKKNHKKLQSALQNHINHLNQSADNLCEQNGDNLHNFSSLVDDVLKENRSKKDLLKDISGQCYLLQKEPFKNTEMTWVTLAGIGAVVGGTALQLIPVAGNLAGAVLIGAGTTAMVGEAALNSSRASSYEKTAKALKNTNHISFNDYLRFKETQLDKRNDLFMEGGFLAADFAIIAKLKPRKTSKEKVSETILVNEYSEVINIIDEAESVEDIENLTRVIHEIWKKSDESSDSDNLNLFSTFNTLNPNEKIKFLEIIENNLKSESKKIPKKTQNIIDTYRAELKSELAFIDDLVVNGRILGKDQEEIFRDLVRGSKSVVVEYKPLTLKALDGGPYRPVDLDSFRKNYPYLAERIKVPDKVTYPFLRNKDIQRNMDDLLRRMLNDENISSAERLLIEKIKEAKDPKVVSDFFEQLQAEAYVRMMESAEANGDVEKLKRIKRGQEAVDTKEIENIFRHRANEKGVKTVRIDKDGYDRMIEELVYRTSDGNLPKDLAATIKDIKKKFADGMRYYPEKTERLMKIEIANARNNYQNEITAKLFFYYKRNSVLIRDGFFESGDLAGHGWLTHGFQQSLYLDRASVSEANEMMKAMDEPKTWDNLFDNDDKYDSRGQLSPEQFNRNVLRPMDLSE